MKKDKYHCPNCLLMFDTKNHLPHLLPGCSHSLCSYCLNLQLHEHPNLVICPVDKKEYKDINNFNENSLLLEDLQDNFNISFNHPSNINYDISQNEENFFSESLNESNLSIISSSHCYLKKSQDLRNILNNNLNCDKHSLPLNVICIDENKKICSQCALNNEHVNHQIITENEFMNNIDNLIDLFQEVDNNQIKYLNFNNINTKNALSNISNTIEKLIDMINKTKEDIINNINNQCSSIENYLNTRKKEIITKYEGTNFDMAQLRQTTLIWMQNVTNKLDLLNNDDQNVNCVKFLDSDPDKNIFNLLKNGKQLNGRYKFVQETIKIIDKLESFKISGIKISPNQNIIGGILANDKKEKKGNVNENKNKKENENSLNDDSDIELNLNINQLNEINEKNNKKGKEDCIKSSLFEIKENNELINSLHLRKFKFEFIKNKNNNNIVQEDINVNKDNIKKEEIIDSEINKKEKEKENNNNNIIEINNNSNNNNKNILNQGTISNIDDLSFINDTLLINSINPNSNNNNQTIQNESINSSCVYRKKIKSDYETIHNVKKELKETKEINNSQNADPIITKKINLSSINNNNNFNNNNKITEKPIEMNNKKEIIIDFKKEQRRNSDYIKSDKKKLLTKTNTNTINNIITNNIINNNIKEVHPIVVSRSPERLYNSKFNGIYNTEKNYTKKINEKFINKKSVTINPSTNFNNNNIISNNNMCEIKPKKELQDFIINQLKNNAPNFSRINLSGYGIQLICSYLHKNPNKNYKEMKFLGCNLNDDDLFLLVRTLLDHNISLLVLNLSSNKITDDSSPNILDLIKDLDSLKGLSLYNNLISNMLKEKLKEYTQLGRVQGDFVQLYI